MLFKGLYTYPYSLKQANILYLKYIAQNLYYILARQVPIKQNLSYSIYIQLVIQRVQHEMFQKKASDTHCLYFFSH